MGSFAARIRSVQPASFPPDGISEATSTLLQISPFRQRVDQDVRRKRQFFLISNKTPVEGTSMLPDQDDDIQVTADSGITPTVGAEQANRQYCRL